MLGSMYCFELVFLFFSKYVLGNGIAGSTHGSSISRTSILFSLVAAHIYILSSSVKGFLFSTSSPTFVIFLLAICVFSLEKCPFRCSATFWLSCLILLWYQVVWAIYIVWILPLVSCIICKYFPPFWSLSLHWSVVSFVVQKLLSLIRSPLFIFGFVPSALGDISNK